MAVLGKEKLRVSDQKDRDYYIEIEFTINVKIISGDQLIRLITII